MAPSKRAGVQGSNESVPNIKDGTLSRQQSPKPGILSLVGSEIHAIGAGIDSAADTALQNTFDTAATWLFAIERLPQVQLHPEVSFELQEALKLPAVSTSSSGLSDAEKHVLAWLRNYQDDIVRGEQEFKIDRRSIAGAIAWEALVNVERNSIRGVGPGKVHILTGLLGSDNTIAKEIEQRGYLKPETFLQRVALLETAKGAIQYIGAIMGSLADKAEQYAYQIRCNPPILTTVYQRWDLVAWENNLSSKTGQDLEPANMGEWVKTHMDYLTDAVGKSALFCASQENMLRARGWKAPNRIEKSGNIIDA